MKHDCSILRVSWVAALVVTVAGGVAVAIPPASIRPMSEEMPSEAVSRALPVSVDLVAADGAIAGGGFPALNVNLLSQVPISEFPDNPGGANDVWGYVSPSGREYALVGLRVGTGFVDITDPTDPIVLANLPDAPSTWSDMAVYGEYAYNVNDTGGDGLQIFDMTQIDSGLVSYIGSVTNGLSTSHNVFVNPDSGFLYTCGSNGVWGLIAFDLNGDPANPQFAGTWTEQYTHDVYVTNYDDCPYAGRSGPCEIAFSFSGGWGMVIIDVTDKFNMVTIANFFYPDQDYCHQGWLTEDKRYIIMGDEGDEFTYAIPSTTYVVDVQDLASPTLVTSFNNGISAVDHNLMVRGHYVFEANYESGLRVYDIGDLNNVQEVGYFDTYPVRNAYSYNGAWGVYSGLPSGVVLVSDGTNGLFVLDASPAVGCQQDSHCNDHNDCTADVCDVSGTCINTPLAAGTACDDGEECTINGTCDAGGNCVSDDLNTLACDNDPMCLPGTCDFDTGFCTCVPCVRVDSSQLGPDAVSANRFLIFTPGSPGVPTALRVTISNTPPGFESLIGEQVWLQDPAAISELPGQVTGAGPQFLASNLGCEPAYLDWGSLGEIKVYGEAVIPGATYAVQAISQGCHQVGTDRYSPALVIENAKWGDVVGNCAVSPCTPPDGSVDVSTDVVSLLDKFQSSPGAPIKARADLEPSVLDMKINITDVTVAIEAFTGEPYPFPVPAGCP